LNEEIAEFLQQNYDSSRGAVELAMHPCQADAMKHGGYLRNTLIKLRLKSSVVTRVNYQVIPCVYLIVSWYQKCNKNKTGQDVLKKSLLQNCWLGAYTNIYNLIHTQWLITVLIG